MRLMENLAECGERAVEFRQKYVDSLLLPTGLTYLPIIEENPIQNGKNARGCSEVLEMTK